MSDIGIEEIVQRDIVPARGFATRKEQAQYIMQTQYPHIVFRLLDNKPYSDLIWKTIQPSSTTTFRRDEES